MPILGSCCCVLDLKVGTKIIGIIKLIGFILLSLSLPIMLVLLLFADKSIDIASEIHEEHRRNNFQDDDYVDANAENTKALFTLIQENLTYVQIALYIMLSLSLLGVITTSMLIHGVRRDRRGLMLPFIIQEVLNIVIFIALDISVAVLFGFAEILLVIVLTVGGGCIIEIYLLLVVISQYQALGLLRMHEEISMK